MEIVVGCDEGRKPRSLGCTDAHLAPPALQYLVHPVLRDAVFSRESRHTDALSDRARISEFRLRFLRVFGDCAVGEGSDPGYSRFTRQETASSKVKIKLPSALKACGSRCPIGV